MAHHLKPGDYVISYERYLWEIAEVAEDGGSVRLRCAFTGQPPFEDQQFVPLVEGTDLVFPNRVAAQAYGRIMGWTLE